MFIQAGEKRNFIDGKCETYIAGNIEEGLTSIRIIGGFGTGNVDIPPEDICR